MPDFEDIKRTGGDSARFKGRYKGDPLLLTAGLDKFRIDIRHYLILWTGMSEAGRPAADLWVFGHVRHLPDGTYTLKPYAISHKRVR